MSYNELEVNNIIIIQELDKEIDELSYQLFDCKISEKRKELKKKALKKIEFKISLQKIGVFYD